MAQESMIDRLQDHDVVHCKLPPWERCNCGSGATVTLRRFKQFGDFVCVKPKKIEPRDLVTA